jgi:RimJ/RimL family protein N-acetyltransferase
MFATRHVQIRALRPDEAGRVLDAVFADLSPESRRLRFHTGMARLPDNARALLTQIDGNSHTGVVAWAGQRPVGLGRMVRVAPGDAEIAIEVVDDWQGRGVGGDLLRALAQRAVGLGYRRLVAEVLPENTPMLRALDRVFPRARRRLDDGTVRVTWTVLDEAARNVGTQELPASLAS